MFTVMAKYAVGISYVRKFGTALRLERFRQGSEHRLRRAAAVKLKLRPVETENERLGGEYRVLGSVKIMRLVSGMEVFDWLHF